MASNKAHGEAMQLVAEAKLKPHERRSLLLGNFTTDTPVGFSVEIGSTLFTSVISQIQIQESAKGRKFVSYITNNEDRPVRIRIWQL